MTDALGTFRFGQLPPGTYQVVFQLPSFRALTVEGVVVNAGATATVNGPLQLETLSESVTVTSTTPTIDLQSTNVGVNWNRRPDGRPALRPRYPWPRPPRPRPVAHPVRCRRNNGCGSTTTGARSYGCTGGELINFYGVVWDQFFGDYNTYDQVQVSGAAKGAESQSPGATLSFVVKSGSNKFSGAYLLAWQDEAFQGDNVTDELLAEGFILGNNKFTRYNDVSLDLGGPIIRDKLWFYVAYGYNYSGLFIPGFVSETSNEQVEYFTPLDNPTFKLTYQMSKNNKLELTEQVNRKWQPTGRRAPSCRSKRHRTRWPGRRSGRR